MKIGIVGGGVFGTATAWEAAQRGHEVILYERDEVPSPLAASRDITKGTRLEYGVHTPRYAPLVHRAFQRWRAAEELSGLSFYHNTGVLALSRDFSPGGFEYESWTHLESLGLCPEARLLEASEGRKRFPQFGWDEVDKAIHNPEGGWLFSTLATQALGRCAELAGAQVSPHSEVLEVGDGWLKTAQGRVDFDAVVVAAGVWAGRLLPGITESLRVTRQRITYYRPDGEFAVPFWFHDPAESGWYGFPMNSDGIVKVALHQRSETVDPDAGREIDEEFLELSRVFVKGMLPGLDPQSLSGGKSCFYANSPDGDLVIEKLGEGLLVAGFGSGHGFKFGPVLGEIALGCLEGGGAEFRLSQARGDLTW